MDIKSLPLGFGMALAQNEAAMKTFESFSKAEKDAIVQRTRQVNSKREMRSLVANLAGEGGNF